MSTLIEELEQAVALAVESTARERERALESGDRARTYAFDVYIACVRERIEHIKKLEAAEVAFAEHHGENPELAEGVGMLRALTGNLP